MTYINVNDIERLIDEENISTIFLDIDGVLRTYNSDLEHSKRLGVPIFRGTDRLFDNKCVDNLNEIIYLTGAKIVITSNWRLRLTFDELKEAFYETQEEEKNRGWKRGTDDSYRFYGVLLENINEIYQAKYGI